MSQQAASTTRAIPIVTLGTVLSAFFAVTLAACLLLALIITDTSLHMPWLAFFPWFEWTPTGILIAFVEAILYGWYVALVFGGLYNFISARMGR